MTITNNDVKSIPFLNEINEDGNIVKVMIPHNTIVGTIEKKIALRIMGDLYFNSGSMHTVDGVGRFWIGGPDGREVKTASSGDVVAVNRALSTVQITNSHDREMGATSGGTAGNDSYQMFALHLRNNTTTNGAFTGIAMTCTPEVDNNSIGAAIYAERADSSSGQASYDTDIHLATNQNSDNMCLPRMTITHSGTVGIGTMNPFGSIGLAGNLDSDQPNGGLHIYGEGYPQLIVEGQTHSISYFVADEGRECSLNFKTGNTTLWKVGLDDAPNDFDDFFSIKSTNQSSPEFYINTIANSPVCHISGTSAAYTANPGSTSHSNCALRVAQYGAGSGDNYSAGIELNQGNHHGSRNRYVTLNVVADAADGGAQGSAFTIQARDADAGYTKERMRIDGTGSMGVRTATPQSTLHIRQTADGPPANGQPYGGIGDGIIIQQAAAGARYYKIGIGQDIASAGDKPNLFFQGSWGEFGGYIKGYVSMTGLNFTGQHRSIPHNDDILFQSGSVGLIVIASGIYKNLPGLEGIHGETSPTINESLPTVIMSTTRNDKRCFGVISGAEDRGYSREYSTGVWGTFMRKDPDDTRLHINSVGEGAIWVCDINGDLDNGDYITTCEIPGYGMRQDDSVLHNYTVAKITCDCDFDLESEIYLCEEFTHSGATHRRAFVGCTYHCG